MMSAVRFSLVPIVLVLVAWMIWPVEDCYAVYSTATPGGVEVEPWVTARVCKHRAQINIIMWPLPDVRESIGER